MTSKALPEAQIIARRRRHLPTGLAASYVAAVVPAGNGQALRDIVAMMN